MDRTAIAMVRCLPCVAPVIARHSRAPTGGAIRRVERSCAARSGDAARRGVATSDTSVIPAKAGIQGGEDWTPAFAGVTKNEAGVTRNGAGGDDWSGRVTVDGGGATIRAPLPAVGAPRRCGVIARRSRAPTKNCGSAALLRDGSHRHREGSPLALCRPAIARRSGAQFSDGSRTIRVPESFASGQKPGARVSPGWPPDRPPPPGRPGWWCRRCFAGRSRRSCAGCGA